MTDIVLSDLDSTLADTRGREKFAAIGGSHEDWIAYSKACIDDAPITGTIAALRLYADAGYPIFLVSGRNIEAEKETRTWLAIHEVPFHHLRLRKSGDIQHNGQYKAAYVRELRDRGFNPVLMFEDHVGVSELIEAESVPVVTVNPRYEDAIGVNFNNLTDDQKREAV